MIKDIFGQRVKYIFKYIDDSTEGQYYNTTNIIRISDKLNPEGIVHAMIHEEGHAVAYILGLNLFMSHEVEELFIENYTNWLMSNYDITPK